MSAQVKFMSFYEFIEKAGQMQRAGRPVIRFDLGDTNLPVPSAVRREGARRAGCERTPYGPAAGRAELRQAIAAREGCEVEQVVVGPGSKHLIFALMSVLARAGDSVLMPTPTWPAYGMMGAQLGLKMREMGTSMEGGWQMDEAELGDDRLAILCNPLNPTGTVHAKEKVQRLLEQAQAKHAAVILDEAYRGLAYEPIENDEGAIRVRSFSKEFNMEGWRLAYAIAPKDVAKKVISFNQFTITCVPEFVQWAGVKALENGEKTVAKNRRVWKKRQKAAGAILKKGGFEFVKPQAGIYLFVRHPGISDAEAFANRLLEKEGVAVSAGASFGAYPSFMRICPNLDGAELEEACKRIANFAEI